MAFTLQPFFNFKKSLSHNMCFLLIVFLLSVVFSFAFGQTLPPDEVESLRVIARTLGKTDWNFNVDPCSGESGWVDPNPPRSSYYQNAVTCNCSFVNNTVCHVTSIVLKAQNLPGRVPPELVRLPFLQEIELSVNYLRGNIPPELGSMTSLVNISLVGNRVTGRLPRELANISTLANLTLDDNQISGTIPPEFGNLPRIERLTLSSNNFTGELPASLGRLSTLRDFRVSDNNFSGSIPNFIQNWTNIERLEMQASGLSGPIPQGIRSLTNLIELKITDLTGNGSTFPPLNGMSRLRTLILRSCNIRGNLPTYLEQNREMRILDLSFNNLSGPIPDTFESLVQTNYIYLTGNSLDGPVPQWMLTDGEVMDLSYNNLTPDSQPCQQRRLNLFASSKGNTTGIVSCLTSTPCTRTYYSLHINCGGEEVADGGYAHDDDRDSGGPSNFYRSGTNWGFSSTGHYLGNRRPTDSYIWSNSSSIVTQNPQLYMNARLSPLSLTYYGYCLQNGTYIVNLHFAEIMFTNDTTYRSLGRRVFDIYIQENLVEKDFNIANVAGGVNIGIIMNYTAVVTDNTLDIRFYWAGRGTDGIPVGGVYGPLISAISVNPNFTVPSANTISVGAIVGIVFGVLSAILIVVFVLWWKGCFIRKDTLEYELKGVDLQTSSYTYRQIKAATNNFDPANKIGEGGFGPVYMGVLPDGTTIGVKQLSANSRQGNREFITEIGMISALQHSHLVNLYGCCIEGNQLLLIYEYLENNSLARALFGAPEHQLNLDWPTRHKICIGIARGLAYLHEESTLKIVHRDIKATNVLLDKNLSPKITDFGLAKLDDGDNTHMTTRIAGTYGYMAPEYALRGHLTDKADVYSYGVVLLEIVSGKSNLSMKPNKEMFNLLDWANSLNRNGDLLNLVDPRLGSKYKKEEVLTTINVALLCTNLISTERPLMSSVVSMLERKAGARGFNVSDSLTIFKKMPSKKSWNEEKVKMLDNELDKCTVDKSLTGGSSATSMSDLYPLASDTSYWEKKDQSSNRELYTSS